MEMQDATRRYTDALLLSTLLMIAVTTTLSSYPQAFTSTGESSLPNRLIALRG